MTDIAVREERTQIDFGFSIADCGVAVPSLQSRIPNPKSGMPGAGDPAGG